MKEQLIKTIEHNRNKLEAIQEELHNLNIFYLDTIQNDENDKELIKIRNEIKFLENQQDIIVRVISRKKRELRGLIN